MRRVLPGPFLRLPCMARRPVKPSHAEGCAPDRVDRQAWTDSDKVHCYRKLTEDLHDRRERIFENRVARLAVTVAQVGYKRRPDRHAGKPAIVGKR